jgi:hypothetical protein
LSSAPPHPAEKKSEESTRALSETERIGASIASKDGHPQNAVSALVGSRSSEV